MNKTKFLLMLGMAKKAGKTVLGTPLLRREIQNGNNPHLCIISASASENTKKRITNCCDYYHVSYIIEDVTTGELAKAVGSSGEIGCLGIYDKDLSQVIVKIARADDISG